MTAKPHTLHLDIDANGWITWSLDCPYSATEVDPAPGRPCNLLGYNDEPRPDVTTDPDGFDAWSPWTPIPGCFAKQWLNETGEWDEVVHSLNDPSFPVLVDVEIDGSDDDAHVLALNPVTGETRS